MIKALLFDLDGTLLPLDEQEFVNYYFSLLCKKTYEYGYEKNKLISTIWEGTKQMVLNNGTKNNETVFWNYFESVYGSSDDKFIFDDFYNNEFKNAKVSTKPNEEARKVIDFAKSNFNHVILATNPIFPKAATKTRMEWIGLLEEDFSLVTTYENSCFCKPNPKYYLEILSKFDLKPEEALMIGNNDIEDYKAATSIGIKTIIVNDCRILNEEVNVKITCQFKDLIETIKNNI